MAYLRKLFKYTKEDSLIRDSFILFIATMIMNLAGFLYHFVMGRVLGPADYGILGVVLSLFYILLVPFNVIQTSISKFVAMFKAKGDNKSISNLFVRASRKLLLISICAFTVLVFLSYLFLSKYLKIPINVLFIVAISIPALFLLPVVRGVLQGLQSFRSLGNNFIIEAIVKFCFGLILVFLGLGVFGATLGIFSSYIISLLVGFFLIRNYFKKYNKKLNTKIVYKYSWPVFIVLLSLTLFYSLDVMLVKYYFDDVTAGYYAAAALLGRIAFFVSFAIVSVLFPKVAEMHALGKENLHLLKKALFLVSILCGGIILVYLLFPKLVVLVLFGKSYLVITKYIAIFAFLMSIFSYVYLLAFYNLSVNRINFVYGLVLLILLEFLLLVFYHSSLLQVIFVLLILIVLTFIFMLIYTFVKNGKAVSDNTCL
ncbi:oligosaccharide flippase family protein [Candidatus Woesearchaeota archaeon]|nr:oligosaccharide flippase family protein [Candidatus Woesearchaeota archaeon]